MAKKTSPNKAAPVPESYLAQWQRAQADLENLQKRTVTEKAEAVDWAQRQVILDLLPVVDNFDRALAHVPADQKESGWLTGITYIHKQLLDFLARYDVMKVDLAPGAPFDHNRDHAVQTVPSEEIPADHIVSVIAAPYQIKGELLRPGSVIVSSGPEAHPTKN